MSLFYKMANTFSILLATSVDTYTLGFLSVALLMLFFFAFREMLERDYSHSRPIPNELEKSTDLPVSQNISVPFIPSHLEKTKSILKSWSIEHPGAIGNSLLFSVKKGKEYQEILQIKEKFFIDLDPLHSSPIPESALESCLRGLIYYDSAMEVLFIPMVSGNIELGLITISLKRDFVDAFWQENEIHFKSLSKRLLDESWMELGKLDLETGFYKETFFRYRLEDEFTKKEKISLYCIRMESAKNHDHYRNALGEYLRDSFFSKLDLYYLESDEILAFFLPGESEAAVYQVLNHFIEALKEEKISMEFVLGFSSNQEGFKSPMEWLDQAKSCAQEA
jgi:hypothetical protein